jgi:hypothetical protein
MRSPTDILRNLANAFDPVEGAPTAQEWGKIRAAIFTALRSCEAEGEDAKRLDWLEQLTIPSEEINDLIRNWCVNGKRYPEGIRAAVDAAMRVWT